MQHQSVFHAVRQLILVVITTLPVAGLADPAGDAPEQGELAATIRNAGLPCNHVLEVTAAGTQAWRVKCNSGSFYVASDPDGQLTASQID